LSLPGQFPFGGDVIRHSYKLPASYGRFITNDLEMYYPCNKTKPAKRDVNDRERKSYIPIPQHKTHRYEFCKQAKRGRNMPITRLEMVSSAFHLQAKRGRNASETRREIGTTTLRKTRWYTGTVGTTCGA
jgi:hypothetical protein